MDAGYSVLELLDLLRP